MGADCIFCKIARGEIKADVVYEDDRMLIFNDIRPQAPIHMLAIPKKHVSTLNDMTADDGSLVSDMILKFKKMALEKGVEQNGYRIVINCNRDGGQEVFHLHLHFLAGRKMTWPPG